MRSPRHCMVLFCPSAKAAAAAAAAEQHVPLPLLDNHASNHCIQRREGDGTGLETSRPIRLKLHLKVKEVHILPVRSVFFKSQLLLLLVPSSPPFPVVRNAIMT